MIYNQRNHVEISINKKKLKEMSKETSIPIMELNDLIEKILTTTHKSTLTEINQWIDENVPSLPEIEIIVDDETVDPFDEFNMEELNDWFNEKHNLQPETEKPISIPKNIPPKVIEEIFEILEDQIQEANFHQSSIIYYRKDMLRDNLKLNLASSGCKDGRFYRIRFGTFLEHDLLGFLNEDKDKPSYQFMERMVDFAYNRTLKNLEDNYEKYCPSKEIQEYLQKNLKVICKFRSLKEAFPAHNSN